MRVVTEVCSRHPTPLTHRLLRQFLGVPPHRQLSSVYTFYCTSGVVILHSFRFSNTRCCFSVISTYTTYIIYYILYYSGRGGFFRNIIVADKTELSSWLPNHVIFGCELGPDAFTSSFDPHSFIGQVGFLIDAILSKSQIR